jgi:hypothetical protein
LLICEPWNPTPQRRPGLFANVNTPHLMIGSELSQKFESNRKFDEEEMIEE